MSLVTLAAAKLHLRVDDSADDTLIQAQLNAAERLCADYIGREVYADQASLDAARASAPTQLASATTAYQAAVEAAQSLTDGVQREAALSAAEMAYDAAQARARRIHAGVVLDDVMRAAVLLVVGSLYADRESAEIPLAAQSLLASYKLFG